MLNHKAIKNLLLLVLVSILWACATSDTAPSKVLNYQKSDNDYQALVAKISTGTGNKQDFDSLIKIFPLTSFYDPKSDQEQLAKLVSQSHMEAGNWQSCLDVNSELLKLNYTSLTGHYGASVCAVQLNKLELGKFHNKLLDSFIEAIWRTGDGKTPETALYITSVNDLYAFIQLHQMVAVGQSLAYVDDLPVQAIRIKDPKTNRLSTWYFDVTPQFRRGVIDNIEKQGQ